MKIWTIRLRPRRLAAALAGTAAAVCGVALLLGLMGRATPASASPAGSKKVRTAEDRLEYLASYGWQVREEPLAVEELTIPESFGPEYADYLDLQESQGFDLTRCAGKAVKRYTYEILNYPTGEAGVQASLLIYKNRVVGADVLSPALDGFIHGLTPPTQSTLQELS